MFADPEKTPSSSTTITCISSLLPLFPVVYGDVLGATPNSSAYCHLRRIGELAETAPGAVATIIVFALTEVTRIYVVPLSTETKSPT